MLTDEMCTRGGFILAETLASTVRGGDHIIADLAHHSCNYIYKAYANFKYKLRAIRTNLHHGLYQYGDLYQYRFKYTMVDRLVYNYTGKNLSINKIKSFNLRGLVIPPAVTSCIRVSARMASAFRDIALEFKRVHIHGRIAGPRGASSCRNPSTEL